MMGFTKAKNESSTWKSPAMYTHQHGYKILFEIMASGCGGGLGKDVCVKLWSTPGEFYSQLRWPVKVEIKVKLINQHGGDNIVVQRNRVSFHKCGVYRMVAYIGNKYYSGYYHLIDHSELDNYLVNDTLCFCVSTLVL